MAEKDKKPNIKQEQIHNLLFNREIGWQEIIYDLINTEQLDPWDINITILTDKYLERIRALEQEDFFISSKVLLAASLLLRIKSETLLNKYLKSIDEILFGKEEKVFIPYEKIELEEEIPEILSKSPLPRHKKVTLKELIDALNRAIVTENRRIKKEVRGRNVFREVSIVLPNKKLNIKQKIKSIYESLLDYFRKNNDKEKVPFSEFVTGDKKEIITSFSSLLYLEDQKKVWLEQGQPFSEIFLWQMDNYMKNNPGVFQFTEWESLDK